MKLTLELCDAVGFAVEVIFGQHTTIYIAPMLLDFLFTAYFLWVVYAFMMELNPKTLLMEGNNKFVKFFKKGGGSNRNSGIGTGDEETDTLNTVLDD
jgi:hypothetical protein